MVNSELGGRGLGNPDFVYAILIRRSTDVIVRAKEICPIEVQTLVHIANLTSSLFRFRPLKRSSTSVESVSAFPTLHGKISFGVCQCPNLHKHFHLKPSLPLFSLQPFFLKSFSSNDW